MLVVDEHRRDEFCIQFIFNGRTLIFMGMPRVRQPLPGSLSMNVRT
jgi:hypothetical protein